MNNPWELSRIDREIYKDYSQDSLNREELLMQYADFVQQCQDEDAAKPGRGAGNNNILVKPLVYLFKGEYKGSEYRSCITEGAAAKENVGNIRKVIYEALDLMRKDNPEALLTRNGDKVFRPKWMLEEMAIKDAEWQIEKAQMEAD